MEEIPAKPYQGAAAVGSTDSVDGLRACAGRGMCSADGREGPVDGRPREIPEGEERLRRMLNIAVVGVLTFDESGTVLESNDAFLIDIRDRKEAEAALWESKAQLAADLAGMRRLHELHSRLAQETGLEVALHEILAAAVELAGTDRGTMQILRPDSGRLEIVAERGHGHSSRFIEHFRHSGFSQGCDAAKREKRRLIIEDVRTFPGLVGTEDGEATLADDILAAQSTPVITRKGEIVGVLSTQYRRPYRPSDDELRLLDLLAWIAADFVERHRAESALRRAHDELEIRVVERTAELARANESLRAEIVARDESRRRLAYAQEEERRRVSRELHDSVGQLLASLRIAIKAAADSGPLPAAANDRLMDVQRLADLLGKEVHGLAVRLRPTALDDLGLEAALVQLVDELSARAGIEVDLQTAGLQPVRIPDEVGTVLYRVIQEALTNVGRHARARSVVVTAIRHDGHATAAIEDDGIGFDPEPVREGRLGLVGMRERVTLIGGTLDIDSEPGRGTTIIARIPLSGAEEGRKP
jgi:signal transduction histidine kinase